MACMKKEGYGGSEEGIIACLALSATQSRCNGLGSLFYIVNFSQELSQFFLHQLDSHIFETKSETNNERSHFIIIKLFHFFERGEKKKKSPTIRN